MRCSKFSAQLTALHHLSKIDSHKFTSEHSREEEAMFEVN
jgi:hypothetical protein